MGGTGGGGVTVLIDKVLTVNTDEAWMITESQINRNHDSIQNRLNFVCTKSLLKSFYSGL